jgi:hypothetical protein
MRKNSPFPGEELSYQAFVLSKDTRGSWSDIAKAVQGRFSTNMSWDDMMRSLSDPVYGYDAQGNPSFPHVSHCKQSLPPCS